jgi:hypothetical protein
MPLSDSLVDKSLSEELNSATEASEASSEPKIIFLIIIWYTASSERMGDFKL